MVWGSKVSAAPITTGDAKSMKSTRLVLYCSRLYLLAVGLTRCTQVITIFRLPDVLTLNWTPSCLFSVP
jgi:hypothetical protein